MCMTLSGHTSPLTPSSSGPGFEASFLRWARLDLPHQISCFLTDAMTVTITSESLNSPEVVPRNYLEMMALLVVSVSVSERTYLLVSTHSKHVSRLGHKGVDLH